MNKALLLFLFIAFSTALSAQTFEGRINYKIACKNPKTGLADANFTAMMGTTQEYYIKGGDYKSVGTGSFFQGQLYVNRENKLYSKMGLQDTWFWNNAAINGDVVTKAEIRKNVVKILGYDCDELTLTCRTGVQKYYFSARLGVDPALFVNHKFGNWYDFVSRSKALPLKYIIRNPQFVLEATATEVKPMKLEKSFFTLPAGAKSRAFGK
ncbi:MAG: hypothetical protein EOP49_49470 [Sphingobacteriales bacterium]|nr:MAG: hypothetical protein EOP49_49470 [Sphingobacteriales bacterium]